MLSNHKTRLNEGEIMQSMFRDTHYNFIQEIKGICLDFDFIKQINSELINPGDCCNPPEYKNTLEKLEIYNINVSDNFGDEIHPDLYDTGFIIDELTEIIELEL